MKEQWRVSTNGILHLMDHGYYKCIRAVGKPKGCIVTEHEQFSSIKCKNCLRRGL